MDTDMMLDKRDGESEFDYHKRLINAKLVDKTLDLDYATLSPYLFGKAYAPDVARRMAYGSARTLKLLEDDLEQRASETASSQILNEIDMKQIELQKERQRFSDQRREFNKLVAKEGRLDHLCDTLATAANNLNKTVPLLFGPELPAGSYGDNEAVLVLADWHYGLVANNVFNVYNKEICLERVKEITMRAAERIALHNCSTLHIVCLGDFIHGAIHTGTRVAAEELVCDQIMQVSEILAQTISKLSTVVEKTYVYMTYGNHGRTVQKKKDSTHRDNMERLIPWWIAERLADHRSVEMVEDLGDEFIILSVAGHDIAAAHGDLDGVKQAARLFPALFSKQYGRSIECIILADKHHRESFEELGVTSMICGSLCGADDWANEKRLYSTPSQMLLIVNPVHGIDAEYRIEVK